MHAEGLSVILPDLSLAHALRLIRLVCSSVTDDSEEWAYEDETISPSADSQ